MVKSFKKIENQKHENIYRNINIVMSVSIIDKSHNECIISSFYVIIF